MGFIRLSESVSYHQAEDFEVTLLRATDGATLSLNRIATRLLSAALQCDTQETVLAALQTTIDASEQELSEALYEVIDPLLEGGWIAPIEDPVARLRPDSGDVPCSVLIASLSSCERDEGAESKSNEVPIGDRHSPYPAAGFAPLSDWDGNWEIFLTGALHSSPLPTFSWRAQWRAAFRASALLLQVRCIRLLARIARRLLGLRGKTDIWEWRCIHHGVADLRVSQNVRERNLEPSLLARLARRELLITRLLSHLLMPDALCLERSIATCSYLRQLCLPAQIVIGQSRFGKADRFAFHAWVEVAGQVVNDLAELKMGYTVLQRIPPEADLHPEAPSRARSSRAVALVVGTLAFLVALIFHELIIGHRSRKRT